MGVETDGLPDLFDDLDDLKDDYSGPVEPWIVGTPVEYAPPLEFGSSAHPITPNDADALRFEIGGEIQFAKEVSHPGTDPTPFFRPAVNEVRLQGPEGFIRHNTNLGGLDEIESTRDFLKTLSLALENRIKKIITQKGLVDTGTLRISVQAVPLGDVEELMQ